MAKMRNKAVTCEGCMKICYFTADLGLGKITKAIMPIECGHPTKCARKHIVGIFDRQFGATIISPEKF